MAPEPPDVHYSTSELVDYFSGDLSDDDAAAVQKHLGRCAACMARAQAVTESMARVDRWTAASHGAAYAAEQATGDAAPAEERVFHHAAPREGAAGDEAAIAELLWSLKHVQTADPRAQAAIDDLVASVRPWRWIVRLKVDRKDRHAPVSAEPWGSAPYDPEVEAVGRGVARPPGALARGELVARGGTGSQAGLNVEIRAAPPAPGAERTILLVPLERQDEAADVQILRVRDDGAWTAVFENVLDGRYLLVVAPAKGS